MKGKGWLVAIGIILVIQIAIVAIGIPDGHGKIIRPGLNAESIGSDVETYDIVIAGHHFGLHYKTAIFSLIVILIWIFFVFMGARKLSLVPGRWQSIMEMFVEAFNQLVVDSLGPEMKKFMPFMTTIFAFVWISNLLGVIPMLEEPTKDLNVPIGLMLLILGVVHITAIKEKGIIRYLKDYFEPIPFLMPLNVVGEIAKGVSLAFRLFGNILGGGIIIIIISGLVKYLLLPPFLNAFFGIFVGTVQAFVFTMLAMTYLAVAIAE